MNKQISNSITTGERLSEAYADAGKRLGNLLKENKFLPELRNRLLL